MPGGKERPAGPAAEFCQGYDHTNAVFGKPAGPKKLDDIKEGAAYQVSRLIGQVERTVMEMRMVPVEKVVPKLKRILRDISRDEKKDGDWIRTRFLRKQRKQGCCQNRKVNTKGRKYWN